MDKKQTMNLKELLRMRKEVINEDDYKEILEKYKMDEIDPKFTERQHRIITARAARLAHCVIMDGGAKNEVKTAILNLMICMDSMKHRLDWNKWKTDNGINLLTRKYMIKIVEV